MIGLNFPVSDYYKEHLLDAITISRTGMWWSAILLINNPKTLKPFVALYKFQKRDDAWKVRQKIHINSKKDIEKYVEALTEFSEKI